MLKGFSVQQVLGAAGPANSVLYLNSSGVVTGDSTLTYTSTGLGIRITPVYRLHVLGPGTSNHPTIAANSNRGNGNAGVFSMFAFNNASAEIEYARLFSTIDANTAGAESGSVVIQVRNAGALAERLRLPAAGGMVVGAAAIATNATDGFLYVPTCAGAPTGTPTARTGTSPIVVDTTNNKLYFYSGGSWRDAGP